MKHLKNILWVVLLTVTFLFSACNNNEGEELTEDLVASEVINNPQTADESSAANKKLAKFQFEYTDFDFGFLFAGEKVVHKFKFTNVGDADLIITDVSATCGCTIPKYSKKPVKPGEDGFIEVEFDSSGRKGQQHKSVTVLANTQPNRVQLSFIAEIEESK